MKHAELVSEVGLAQHWPRVLTHRGLSLNHQYSIILVALYHSISTSGSCRIQCSITKQIVGGSTGLCGRARNLFSTDRKACICAKLH